MSGTDRTTDGLPLPAMPYTYGAEPAAAAPEPSGGSTRWSAKRNAATAAITIVLPQLLQSWLAQNGAQLPTLPDLTLDPTPRTA